MIIGESLYGILGVQNNATSAEIHQAYLALAKKCHPDLNGGTESEEFLAIKRARDILSDPENRAIYDETGMLPDDPDNKIDIMAIAIMRDMMLQVLNGHGPDVNMLQHMTDMLNQQRKAVEDPPQRSDHRANREGQEERGGALEGSGADQAGAGGKLCRVSRDAAQ